MTHWNYLAKIATINQQKKLSLSIILVLNWNFLNTVIVTAIVGRRYRWNSSYWKLKQYRARWLFVQSTPIRKLLFHTKIGDLLHGIFSRKFWRLEKGIVAWRSKMQYSRFKKKSMKASFKQNITDSRKPRYVSAIVRL